jgi:hypothetical protein
MKLQIYIQQYRVTINFLFLVFVYPGRGTFITFCTFLQIYNSECLCVCHVCTNVLCSTQHKCQISVRIAVAVMSNVMPVLPVNHSTISSTRNFRTNPIS